jgi:hypothetical protein
VKRDGTMRVVKAPLPARTFIQTAEYLDWLAGIDRDVTYLMGHTRWPTRGSERNPANNHPLVAPVALDQAGSARMPTPAGAGLAIGRTRRGHAVLACHYAESAHMC